MASRPPFRALAWDPRSPASLLLVPSTINEDLTETKNADVSEKETTGRRTAFSEFLSHGASGCSKEETSALIRILDARDEHLRGDGSEDNFHFHNEEEEMAWAKSLSHSYRSALHACLLSWDKNAEPKEIEGASANATSLEAMKMSYALLHLSEIFLLRPHRFSSNSNSSPAWMAAAGSASVVSPEVVRYLRLHHLPNPLPLEEGDQRSTPPESSGTTDTWSVQGLLNSEQPEQFNSTLYWSLVFKSVHRGYTQEAWALLSRHSVHRRIQEAMERQKTTGTPYAYNAQDPLDDDARGFRILRALLLSAPLPGGRFDTEYEDIENDLYDLDNDDNDQNRDAMLFTGVPPSAWTLWEKPSSSSPPYDINNPSTLPNWEAAASAHRTWSQCVRAHLRRVDELHMTANRSTDPQSALARLVRRIPWLRRVLMVLAGRFDSGTTSNDVLVDFGSWHEALCAELLYKRPTILPQDVHVRASVLMQQFGDDVGDNSPLNEVLLRVMRGDAGKVLEMMHTLGGGSGAALPATMTALLCDLLVGVGQLPSEATANPLVDLPTEFFISAAHAIQSSFAVQRLNDVGVRLAVRLLLPRVLPSRHRRNVETDRSHRIVCAATVSDLLSRHVPKTDAEARSLIALCAPILKGCQSIRIAEACDEIALCRYRHHLSNYRPGGAVHWLLRGMECWTFLSGAQQQEGHDTKTASKGALFASSSCRRHFESTCNRAIFALLAARAELGDDGIIIESASSNEQNEEVDGNPSVVNHLLEVAKDIAMSISDDDMAVHISSFPYVALLQHVVDIVLALAIQSKSSGDGFDSRANSYMKAAHAIVQCLEERLDDSDRGNESPSVVTLAHPNYYENFLLLALEILEREEHDSESETSIAFDVHSIQVLMGRLSDLECDESIQKRAVTGKETAKISSFPKERMKLQLCNGLMRAFVAENARKGTNTMKSSKSLASAPNDGVVGLMLGPSMFGSRNISFVEGGMS